MQQAVSASPPIATVKADAKAMSALPPKQTCAVQEAMSALGQYHGNAFGAEVVTPEPDTTAV
jgi:hypothetical protein